MKREERVYIAWAFFILFLIGIIPFGNILAFPAIIYAVFEANRVKKENPRKGNILIWLSLGLFVILLVILFLRFIIS